MSTNPYSPILDQPQSIDRDVMEEGARYGLANHDLAFAVDAETDLHDLYFPWADELYARHIRIRVSDVHSEAQGEGLTPMVTRYYPGYQEVILGDEGVIISKRLAVPLGNSYERSVMWMLDCQAEGDRLLRLDVEIDWGEPLTQRMVDGLLVAQRNPGRAQGVYSQQNADSTRVFGNPQGRPSSQELDDDGGRATLTYYVLVNGMVEVPLLLTVSDVGEQVAWNGFLALRDAERVFELSVGAWDKLVHTGRLWTSDPRLNRAVQVGRLSTARRIQRVRTGMMPVERSLDILPNLLRSVDTFNYVESRNLLAMVRRLAERSQGRLPVQLPVHPKAELADPGSELVHTNRQYLLALWQHLQRHPDADLAAQHATAVELCAEAVVRLRMPDVEESTSAPALDGSTLALAGAALRQAVNLATLMRDSANAMRWESEACEYERLAEEAGNGRVPREESWLENWPARTGWTMHENRPWRFAAPEQGIALAGEAVWQGCGLQWRQGQLAVYPRRSNDWNWWALLDLPLADGPVSLVWDGTTLHSTRPVRSEQPVRVYSQIRARNTDELEFDLLFEMRGQQPVAETQSGVSQSGTSQADDAQSPEPGQDQAPQSDPVIFRPQFDQSA